MLVREGNHIGDSWYFVHDGAIHCYYLTCPASIPRHKAWDIAHAVSNDLVHWEEQGVVIRRGDPDAWDGGCLATGSVIAYRGRFWMAYTVNWDKPNVAVGLAVSDDLFRWEKQFGRPITCIDERFYERTGSGARPISHWRDPYLFEFDGHVYHYVCASVAFGPIDCRGTLGLARSTDMMQWEVLPPPSIGLIAQELECPQVLQIAGRYLLFFSAFPELFPSFRRENHTCELRHAVYCVQGASQFGPFFGSTLRAVLPADYPVQPYAGQIVQWKGKTWLLGTVWDDVQDYICDPIELFLGGDGVVSCLALERHTEPR